ncbi:MAG: hypothetical protein IJ131_03235, partial [Eggerthellaceae bacterium]|nr:hypothetical protein [Eggerthellaceae bacterium]
AIGDAALAGKVAKGSSGMPRWLPYAAVAAVGCGVLAGVLFFATGGQTQGVAPAGGTEAAQQETEAANTSAYYLADYNGHVAIFRSGQDEPYKETSTETASLPDDVIKRLGSHIPATSAEDAQAQLDQINADVQAAAEEASEPVYPAPVFTDAIASSELPPDQTTSYYGPRNVLDDNFRTAWNEGADNAGEGQWIELRATEPQHVSVVSIAAGYNKSDEVYYNNSRPCDITLTFSDGSTQNAHLEDRKDTYQDITLDSPKDTTLVRITINSVYFGSQYADCCITEVKVR